ALDPITHNRFVSFLVVVTTTSGLNKAANPRTSVPTWSRSFLLVSVGPTDRLLSSKIYAKTSAAWRDLKSKRTEHHTGYESPRARCPNPRPNKLLVARTVPDLIGLWVSWTTCSKQVNS